LNPDYERIISRFLEMEDNPINVTHLNQLLHLVHEAGVTKGFFEYYFLTAPVNHLYPVRKVTETLPPLDDRGIASLEQLDWGLRRFHIDALLFFGNIRSAYREFRVMDYKDIESFFDSKRIPSDLLTSRGKALPFCKIPINDRYLISELACKAYSPISPNGPLLVEQLLMDAYRKAGMGRVSVRALCDKNSSLAREDPQGQMMLKFATDEFADEYLENETDIRERVGKIYQRFEKARQLALKNTRLFLSLVNELDVYAATSMRMPDDFRNMARDCDFIFHQPSLRRFCLRHFDPTISAAEGHEDKGLIECLMVKCCRALLYFAGTGDSYGKDAEVAMSMSLGKPAIILCPSDEMGTQRARFFRDIHPLSRLIDFKTGVACGAIVTQDRKIAAQILERIFDNSMEYDLENDGNGYLRLRERLTQSVVRLQTNDRLLCETFWNYYHGIQ
jgi:hypothetical protein